MWDCSRIGYQEAAARPADLSGARLMPFMRVALQRLAAGAILLVSADSGCLEADNQETNMQYTRMMCTVLSLKVELDHAILQTFSSTTNNLPQNASYCY